MALYSRILWCLWVYTNVRSPVRNWRKCLLNDARDYCSHYCSFIQILAWTKIICSPLVISIFNRSRSCNCRLCKSFAWQWKWWWWRWYFFDRNCSFTYIINSHFRATYLRRKDSRRLLSRSILHGWNRRFLGCFHLCYLTSYFLVSRKLRFKTLFLWLFRKYISCILTNER